MAGTISLDDSFDDFPRVEDAFQRYLDGTLDPRGPDSLFDIVASLGPPAGGLGVDVGCGEGEDTLRLARQFGMRLRGIDPVPRHIEIATAAATSASLGNAVQFHVGKAERLPIADSSADLVWCKEVLMFADLDQSLREFARVLRPNGVGFVFQFFTGARMKDDEAEEFWRGDLAYGSARSVRPSDLELAIGAAGLNVQQRVDFGSEWGEYAQEHHDAGGRRLVHAARLLRAPDRYIDRFGETNYRIMLGDCLWHVYRMIGKLHGAAFVIAK